MAEATGGRAATILAVLIGLAALAWTAHACADAARLTWGGARAVAVALGEEPGAPTHGHPLMEFHLPSGEAVRFRQNGFGPSRVGMTAEVVYDPADPPGHGDGRGLAALDLGAVGPADGSGLHLRPFLRPAAAGADLAVVKVRAGEA